MSKLAIALICSLLQSIALAGVGGGGVGPRPEIGKIDFKPEIVFNMGQENGLVKFAYGELVGNQWQIKKIEMPKAELTLNPSAASALEKSKALQQWVEINK